MPGRLAAGINALLVLTQHERSDIPGREVYHEKAKSHPVQ